MTSQTLKHSQTCRKRQSTKGWLSGATWVGEGNGEGWRPKGLQQQTCRMMYNTRFKLNIFLNDDIYSWPRKEERMYVTHGQQCAIRQAHCFQGPCWTARWQWWQTLGRTELLTSWLGRGREEDEETRPALSPFGTLFQYVKSSHQSPPLSFHHLPKTSWGKVFNMGFLRFCCSSKIQQVTIEMMWILIVSQ